MYEEMLVAIDQSEAAERVLTAAEELAKLSSGEIWLLRGKASPRSTSRSARDPLRTPFRGSRPQWRHRPTDRKHYA
jgi:hypothetical protein